MHQKEIEEVILYLIKDEIDKFAMFVKKNKIEKEIVNYVFKYHLLFKFYNYLLKVKEYLPAGLITNISSVCSRRINYLSLCEKEFISILNEFKEFGIEFIFLGGFGFRKIWQERDPGGDVDIWIINDYNKASKILVKNGYKRFSGKGYIKGNLLPVQIYKYPFADLPYEFLYSIWIKNRVENFFSPNDALIYLLLWNAYAKYNDKLHILKDAIPLMKKYKIDWEYICNVANECKIKNIIYLGLKLIKLFIPNLPDYVLSTLRTNQLLLSDKIIHKIMNKHRSNFFRKIYLFLLLDTHLQRFTAIYRWLKLKMQKCLTKKI